MNRSERRRQEKEARKLEQRQSRAQPSQRRLAGEGRASRSTPAKREESRSPDLLAAKIALLETFDGFAPLRNSLRKIAKDRQDWAGIPMPIEGASLVIEPKFPKAKGLSEINKKEEEPLPDGVSERNSWWSRRLRAHVIVWNEGGKILAGKIPHHHRADMELASLNAADAWGIEQEANAVQLLGTMLRHRQFKQYLLVGMFAEMSQRSGLTYVFRKLRPTLVIRKDAKDGPRILAALCLHPIGYYGGSWAGAMTPTDDVVAHLTMMRGDEHLFWKRSNQHSPDRPEAGI